MDFTYTIIIPHYGPTNRLCRLLGTIPNRSDTQVIVVDDCTPDYSVIHEIRTKFPSVEVYSTDTNGGGGKARNVGLRKSLGKYVIFADSDDFFLPSFDNILTEYTDSSADIIFFNAISLIEDVFIESDRARNLNQYISLYDNNPEQSIKYLKYLFGEPWCKIVKRSLITDGKIKFQESRIHNDTLFSYMIGLAANNVDVCKKVGYVVIDRPASVSKATNWIKYDTAIEVFAKKNKTLENNGIDVFDNLLFNPLIHCIKSRDWTHFNEYKAKLLKYDYTLWGILKKYISSKVKRICKK